MAQTKIIQLTMPLNFDLYANIHIFIFMDNEEYYIEDNDLIDLLKDVLGEKITDDDI